MALTLLVSLAVALAVLGLSVSPWLTLAAASGILLVLSTTLQSQRTNGESGGRAYLCLCFALLPMTGVHVLAFLSVGEVAALSTVCVFVFKRHTGDTGETEGRPFALLAASFFIVGGSIAAYWNGSRQSLVEISELIVVAVVPILALRHFRPTREDAMALMKAWLIGAVVSGVAGLTFVKPPSGRALGLAAQQNQLAMTSAMALPIIWALHRKGKLGTWPSLAAVLLLVATISESGSRSGLLAAVIGILIISLRSIKVFAAAVFSAVIAVLGTSVIALTQGTSAVARLLSPSSSTANSDKSRLQRAQEALDRLQTLDTQLLGAGFIRHHQPHNLFLFVWSGAGILGIIGLLVLVYRPIRVAARLTQDTFKWSLAVCAIVFLLATSVNNALAAPFAWGVFALLDFRWSPDLPGPPTRASPATAGTAV